MNHAELKALAVDCKEREIDFCDVSPNQGSTSCDKLVRAYIAAASPGVVLALIARVAELEKDAGRLDWVEKLACFTHDPTYESLKIALPCKYLPVPARTVREILDAAMKGEQT